MIVFGPTQFTTQGEINVIKNTAPGTTLIQQVKITDERRSFLESTAQKWIQDDYIADALAKVQKGGSAPAAPAGATKADEGHTPASSDSTPLNKGDRPDTVADLPKAIDCKRENCGGTMLLIENEGKMIYECQNPNCKTEDGQRRHFLFAYEVREKQQKQRQAEIARLGEEKS